jgi:general secretion pathway protein I
VKVSDRNSARGFTLIEVVVAMAIIVVVLAGLFFQLNRVADTSFDLRQRTLAQWIALNRVTDLRLNGVPPIGQKSQGTLEYANQKWRWQSETLRTQIKDFRLIRVWVGLESAPKDKWITSVDGFSGLAVTPPGAGSLINWQGSNSGPPPPTGGGGPTS